jgi:hypothetical protein
MGHVLDRASVLLNVNDVVIDWHAILISFGDIGMDFVPHTAEVNGIDSNAILLIVTGVIQQTECKLF